jgi:hypothetical protein
VLAKSLLFLWGQEEISDEVMTQLENSYDAHCRQKLMSMGDRCCHTLYLDAMSIASQVFRERESIAACKTGKLKHSEMIHQSLISYFDLGPCMSVESILGHRLLKLVLENTIR